MTLIKLWTGVDLSGDLRLPVGKRVTLPLRYTGLPHTTHPRDRVATFQNGECVEILGTLCLLNTKILSGAIPIIIIILQRSTYLEQFSLGDDEKASTSS